jgi:RHS repeat-associated protein
MSRLTRAWLCGIFMGLFAAGGTVQAQIQSGMERAPQAIPAINLGKPVAAIDNTNRRLVTAGNKDPRPVVGGKVTLKSGQFALRYPSTDVAPTNAAGNSTPVGAPAKGAVRANLPPVSEEESQRARTSRGFPQNLNEGASPDASAATGGRLLAARITGDTNARGPASIAELARSLRNNPDLIYQYVRNNIEYYPLFGVQKGALGAVLDNQGTAHDQAMLMVELLRASGVEANYVRGAIKLDARLAAAWYGVDTSNTCAFYALLGQGQIPIYEITAVKAGSCPGLSSALVSVTVEHVWVKAKIDGAWYVFDPSLKLHSVKSGIDLASPGTTGYNALTYQSSTLVGSTSNADSVQNINRANIRNNLTAYASNLANYIRTNKPTATLDDVIGGKTIDPFYGSLRQVTLPYQDTSRAAVESADIPNNLKTTLRIQYQGIDQSYTSDAIYGRRLTITYNAASQPVLKLDGIAVGKPGNAAPAGAQTTINFTVTHNAYAWPDANQSFSQTVRAGGTNTYAIANGWGPSGRGPAENYRKVISDLRATGTADTSEPLLGSTLALIGAQWIAQTDQAGYVTGQLAHSLLLAHHRVGIVGYINSAYVDLPGNVLMAASTAGDSTTEDAAFASWGMHASIVESAAVQQTTGVSAVSTVKLIDIAAAAGQRIYNATAARFATFVQPNLVNCGGQLAAINAALAAGHRVITPARCDIAENSWSGAAYFTVGPGLYLGAVISDGLAGGYSTKPQPAAQTNSNVNNSQQLPSTLAGNAFTYGDPIDMVRGDFLYNHDDIDAGAGAFPQSLSFRRLYSSGMRYSNGPLGKGWTHNFNAAVTTGSDGFQAMGEGSALAAVGTLVEQKASLDLLMDPARPITKLVAAALGQRWFGDQLIENTVIVTQGLDGEVFVKLPDGTYNPPPGKSAKLIKNPDGTYSYESVNRAVLKFNTAGKAETYTDPGGVQVKYYYSGGSDVTLVQNSLGRMLVFSYSGGRITRIANGPGNAGAGLGEIRYGYDVDGNLSTVTDAVGKNTTFSYSLPGRIASIYYPSFPTVAAVTNVYDSLDRVKTQTNARGKTYEYFFAGFRTEEVGPGGVTRTNYVDGRGNIVRSSTPLFNFTLNTYDGQSRLIRTQRPENNALEYTYDDATCAGVEKRCTHNIKTISAVGPTGSSVAPIVQSFTYESAFNQVASATDAKGNVTRYTYTAQGLPLTVTSPADAIGVAPVTTYGYTSYAPTGYPPFSLPTSVSAKTAADNEVVTTMAYDASNRFLIKSQTVDAGPGRLNLTTSFAYNYYGYLASIRDPGNGSIGFIYDAAQRVIQTTDGALTPTTTSYDADGRPVATAVRLYGQWMVTCRRYSATGKVVRVWGPALTASDKTCPAEAAPVSITDTAYDDLDRVSLVTQYLTPAEGGNRVTQTLYNPDDTVQAINRAIGTPLVQASVSYVYTPNGNIDSTIDARTNRTVRTYDVFDRVVRTYYPLPARPNYANAGDYEENTYDPNGNVTALRKRSGLSVTQTWDNLNRLVARTYPNAADSVQFSYDLRGLRTAAWYASAAHSNTYTWDNAGRLSGAVADGRALSYQYDAGSNRKRLTWPDGFYVTADYDSRNHVVQISENGNASLASYGYDDLGRRTGINWNNGATTNFQYDPQGLMAGLGHSLNTPAQSVQYTYTRNQAGELTGVSWNNDLFQWTGAVSGSRSYGVNGLNQYMSTPGGTPAYDANGSLTSDGVASYSYDLDNRLRTAGSGGAAVATLEYDPEGRLQRTVVGAVTTNLLYDGNDLIAEYDAAGVLQRRYVHGPGTDEPIVVYEGAGTAAKSWLYVDHLGSIVVTANAKGTGMGVYTYGPNGEPGAVAGPRVRFTGQQYIAELGLYYYKARFYSPTLGRFLQTDPAGTKDDLNLYAYVGNNPVNRVDPTGLAKVAVGVAIQVAGVVTDPSHYIKRVGAGNIDSVVNVAVGIASSPGFVGTTRFGMTVNGVNYEVRSYVLPMGDINLGTIHPDDGRHR